MPRTATDTPPRPSRQSLPVPAGLSVLSAIGVPIAADDKREYQRCYDLGRTVDVTKPVNHGNFANALRRPGPFFPDIQVAEAE